MKRQRKLISAIFLIRVFEMMVVDDNSPDGTVEIAEELSVKYENVRVLRRPCKLGLASAIMDGIKIARGDVIAVMDADLQHPSELLPEVLKRINEGYDLALASRGNTDGRE